MSDTTEDYMPMTVTCKFNTRANTRRVAESFGNFVVAQFPDHQGKPEIHVIDFVRDEVEVSG